MASKQGPCLYHVMQPVPLIAGACNKCYKFYKCRISISGKKWMDNYEYLADNQVTGEYVNSINLFSHFVKLEAA